MGKPKRHHYVPQFYLKKFADDQDRLWVYDRVNKQYRHQNVEQVASINHYYRIEKKDGTLSLEIEEHLSEIEGNGAAAIEKLERAEPITPEEKAHIAVFIAVQMTRVPDYEKRVNELQDKAIRRMTKIGFPTIEATKEKITRLMKGSGMRGDEVTAEEMYEFIQEDQYGIEIPRQNNIKMMLEMAANAADYFMQMDWFLIRAAKGGSFVTSDNPFTLFPPKTYDPNHFFNSAVGLLTPGALKALPISSSSSLCLLDRGERFVERTVPRDVLRGFNGNYARTSDRFIFAKDEALLRSVIERSGVDEIPVERERAIMS